MKKVEDDQQTPAPPPVMPSILMDEEASRNLPISRLHHQSLLATPTGEQLYNNLYGKDLGLMRKLMNLDEFQYPLNNANNSNINNNNNNNINSTNNNNNNNIVGHNNNGNNNMSAPKTFPNYSNGTFNGKFMNPPSYGFPFDKIVHQNGVRHEGLLKPCYDYPTTKLEPPDNLTDDFTGNSLPAFKKQAPIFSSNTFMNQFNHHLHQHHQNTNNHTSTTSSNELPFGAQHFQKPNEINNNSGIVLKLENGSVSNNDFISMQINNHKTNDVLCPRSSNNNTMNLNKTEPNEFNNSNINNINNNNNNNNTASNNNSIDNDGNNLHDEDNKSSLNDDDSNDGFTNL
ncbi:unnamed protein product [Diamesa tonsa]